MLVAVLAGDGVGPEVVRAALEILDTLPWGDRRPEFREALFGGTALEATGDALPPETLSLAKEADAILVGAVGTPAYQALARKRPGSGLLRLRRELGLFANLRPAKIFPEIAYLSPVKAERVADLDLLIVRELSGGLYYGEPRGERVTASGEREIFNTLSYTEREVERIARVAFRAANERRRRLCSVDKANVLESMALWRETVRRLAPEYPEVQLTHMHADAAAMALVQAPATFDVIVAENLIADILSDEAAAICGSIGLAPSASLGDSSKGLYEPIHGSAPDIAGLNRANPIGTILSAAMMLRISLGRPDLALAVEKAVQTALAAGLRTADIAREGDTVLGTQEMGKAIAEAL